MNKRKFLILVITAYTLMAVLFISCRKIKGEPLVCFQEDVLPLINSHCGMDGCHDPVHRAEDYELTTYDGIMKGIKPGHPRLSKVYNVMRHHEMPPENYPALTDAEIKTIEQWINLGAKNSTGCGICDTSVFTYSAGVKPIMEIYCMGCHNASSPYIADYSDVSVVQQAAADGSLSGSLHQNGSFSSMPKNQPPLPACLLTIFDKWIAAGYPNN